MEIKGGGNRLICRVGVESSKISSVRRGWGYSVAVVSASISCDSRSGLGDLNVGLATPHDVYANIDVNV